MEWQSPKLRDREWIMTIRLPLHQVDCLWFCTKFYKLGEETAGEILLEALAAVYQAETLQREFHKVDKTIRRLASSSATEDFLELLHLKEEWFALKSHAAALREALRRPRFGRHFPRTRHNLSRRMLRLAEKKNPLAENSMQIEAADAIFPQKAPRSDVFSQLLCAPGGVSEKTTFGSTASSVQFNQRQANVDLSASFWDDKMTILEKIITKGEI